MTHGVVEVLHQQARGREDAGADHVGDDDVGQGEEAELALEAVGGSAAGATWSASCRLIGAVLLGGASSYSIRPPPALSHLQKGPREGQTYFTLRHRRPGLFPS
ncbi:MAG: hypothetical protein MZU84_01680 [Sphingobacterium sp.]|nr:hypothetical protein [Sphingobacterium sp.]